MSTIHKSVLCVLPFYWISKMKAKPTTVWLWLIPIFLAFIFKNPLVEFLQKIIGYENYTQTSGAGFGTFMFLLLGLGLFSLVFYKQITERENTFYKKKFLLKLSFDKIDVKYYNTIKMCSQ